MKERILFWAFALAFLPVFGQFPGQMPLAPPNDICAKAIQIDLNERLSGHTNADATISMDFERPEVFPTTCIQTLENDVWFKFRAESGVAGYEIVIAAGFCATPAGLQALLIKSEDCNASKFVYRACSNKINTDTIKLFLENPVPGENYFIWIDGYDGTICEFDVALLGRKALVPQDYRFLRFDYDMSAQAPYPADALAIGFSNNAANISWTARTQDDASLFIIELMPKMDGDKAESAYGRVVGFVEPRKLVGDGEAQYSFNDYLTPFKDGESYDYPLVKVAGDATKLVSETFTVKAKLIESFFLGEILPASPVGSYKVNYINRKKNQNFTLWVENSSGERIKEMNLLKEPVRDGSITINMQEFEQGEYLFVMDNGKEQYKKLFVH